ncbi:MAG: N-acyl homoserine lactonase family protein [Christensenella sp.]|uniref:N-acyl homoserine lactonase family protein n=1 Tax=Christensenella sp. TaxID=1935934 RepID=UPI002B1F0076|nr:N-acyl homoserine lactonase family protein [Christensenella sp.]MEA5002507.1 N-acyl homoserine lactonase family protein [Christensenella sp.]
MKKKVEKTRFTLIHMADFDAYKDEHVTLTPEEEKINKEKRIVWPLNCYAILIQHPELGNVLVDTGIDVGWAARWPKALADGYPISQIFDLRDKLAEMDMTIDDIDMIIISHLHFDHSGNIRLFRDTKAGKNIVVQDAELRNAFYRANLQDVGENQYLMGYVRGEFDGLDGINWKPVEGDVKLADDLELILLAGHTPGTMGVVVRTEETGTVVFPSDAIYNRFNYGPPISRPGMCTNPKEYDGNVEKCRKIAEDEGGQVFFSHDVTTFKTYKTSPEWYD